MERQRKKEGELKKKKETGREEHIARLRREEQTVCVGAFSLSYLCCSIRFAFIFQTIFFFVCFYFFFDS